MLTWPRPLPSPSVWNVSWWSDPIVLGKYPADGLELYKEFLPEITDEDIILDMTITEGGEDA